MSTELKQAVRELLRLSTPARGGGRRKQGASRLAQAKETIGADALQTLSPLLTQLKENPDTLDELMDLAGSYSYRSGDPLRATKSKNMNKANEEAVAAAGVDTTPLKQVFGLSEKAKAVPKAPAEAAEEEEFDFGKAVEMSIADAAKEAAEEANDEVAEMAALAEQEESPSMSFDYAGMPEDGSSVEYQAEKAAEMEMPEEKAAPKAKAVYTPEQAQELFRVTHGGDFDPKSSLDKRKMKEIEETLVEQGGLGDKSPNRFALDIYRKYKYV